MPVGSYLRVDVQCPFFRYDDPDKKTLACEGVTDVELPTKRQFRRREDLRKHMKSYCCTDYRYCEYFRMMMDYKYIDD